MSKRNNRLKETILIICAIISAIAGYFQIVEKINVVGIIYASLVNIWIWFISTKIPLTWLLIGIIAWQFIKWIINISPYSSIERELRNRICVYIVNVCQTPKTANEIEKEIIRRYEVFTEFNYYIKRLENVKAVEYENGKWRSTPEAIAIMKKYHKTD